MLKIASKTKIPAEDVIKNAIKFFGPAGYKLKINSQTETSISFEGGGGTIEISACAENGKTTVDFISREWDFQVKEFIKTIR